LKDTWISSSILGVLDMVIEVVDFTGMGLRSCLFVTFSCNTNNGIIDVHPKFTIQPPPILPKEQ
jgi:hypothetical protein